MVSFKAKRTNESMPVGFISFVLTLFFKEDYLEIAKKIDILISNQSSSSFEESKVFFLEISAFCGEMVKSICNCEWILDELEGTCKVINKEVEFEPLFCVINYWNANLYVNSFSFVIKSQTH